MLNNRQEGKLFSNSGDSAKKNTSTSNFNDDDIYVDEKLKVEKDSAKASAAVATNKTQWEEDEEILSKTVDPKTIEKKEKKQERMDKLKRGSDAAKDKVSDTVAPPIETRMFKAASKASLSFQETDEESKKRALDKKLQLEQSLEPEKSPEIKKVEPQPQSQPQVTPVVITNTQKKNNFPSLIRKTDK